MKKQDSDKPNQRVKNFGKTTVAVLILIVVATVLIAYNAYLQDQLGKLEKSIQTKIANIEKGSVDITVQELDKRLDNFENQQQVNLEATGNMVNYLTFTFTVVGIFFLFRHGSNTPPLCGVRKVCKILRAYPDNWYSWV